MTGELPSFDRTEMGSITIQLQSACVSCSLFRQCSQSSDCPVRLASHLIGGYLSRGDQIVADYSELLSRAKMPAAANLDPARLESTLEQVAALCNKCMFHVDPCFLNLLFRMIEEGLLRDPQKPLSTAPGRQRL